MASVFPFRALRYDPTAVPLADVVTQPYDKITPAMQQRYYQAHPHNLVRIILGKRESGDDERNNVYRRAAQFLREWREHGILCRDATPAVYLYTQRFIVPGSREPRERRGFIALGQLEPYEAGVVFRHEQTLSAPKTDRLNLLRATRAHFGQIFMLYQDPEGEIDRLLAPKAPPDVDIHDEYDVQHRLWPVTDLNVLGPLQQTMAAKKLIIADGHHRYETALRYREERRQAAGREDPNAPYERVMMTFVNMDSPGLLILPTHRVVRELKAFSAGEMVRASRPYFAVEDVTGRFDADQPTALLPKGERGVTVMLVVTRKSTFLFRTAGNTPHPALDGLPLGLAELDVVRLHKVVLESVLGISEQAVREQSHIEYLRDAREAVTRVAGGADAAFLMNPVRMEQVRDLALAGEVLPQKSTDFYPKLLSGLAIYALE